ncbi:hypothetical protein SAMN03159463_05446 [Mesorhizobium sp. NFR06]|nr:hypothetical protein SAMN03159463_05446 [Mesorhizobium sp. NFR06]
MFSGPGPNSTPISSGASSRSPASREVAHPATKILIIDLKDGWIGGYDLAALGMVCDGAILCAYSNRGLK